MNKALQKMRKMFAAHLQDNCNNNSEVKWLVDDIIRSILYSKKPVVTDEYGYVEDEYFLTEEIDFVIEEYRKPYSTLDSEDFFLNPKKFLIELAEQVFREYLGELLEFLKLNDDVPVSTLVATIEDTYGSYTKWEDEWI